MLKKKKKSSCSGQSAEGNGKDKYAHVISFLSHSSRLHFIERRKEGGRRSGGEGGERERKRGNRKGRAMRGGRDTGVRSVMRGGKLLQGRGHGGNGLST